MARRGFTLIEVLMAIALAGLSVSIAAGVLASVTDTAASLARRADATTRERSAALWLDEALLSADVSATAGSLFVGEADSLAFRSFLRTPAGWVEPTTVHLLFRSGRLTIRADHIEQSLGDSLASAALDYLPEYGASSPWLVQWQSATAAPVAVRLRRTHASGAADTTVFFVGRGA